MTNSPNTPAGTLEEQLADLLAHLPCDDEPFFTIMRTAYARGRADAFREAARIAETHNAYEYAISGPRDNSFFRIAHEFRALAQRTGEES